MSLVVNEFTFGKFTSAKTNGVAKRHQLGAKCHGHSMSPKSESRELAKFAPALFLLTISFIINYVDRGNISVAGPLIKRDFHLSDSELGILSSVTRATISSSFAAAHATPS